jgi:hypothetical protein
MVEARELVAFAMILVGASIGFVAFGGAELVGGTSAILCDTPVVSDLISSCGTDVADRYDLETEILLQATDVNVVFDESSFQYETNQVSPYSLSIIGGPGELAFFGANEVEATFELVNSEDETVAYGNKFIGELGALQGEKLEFDADNLPTGEYTVNYELTYTPDFGVTEGNEQVKTLSKQIRIPKRIEG